MFTHVMTKPSPKARIQLQCLTNKTGCHIDREVVGSEDFDLIHVTARMENRNHASQFKWFYDDMEVTTKELLRMEATDETFSWSRAAVRFVSTYDPMTMVGIARGCIENPERRAA